MRNPRTIIGKGNPDMAIKTIGGNGQQSWMVSLGHGAFRIENDIEENLLHLMVVDYNLRQIGSKLSLYFDIIYPVLISTQSQDVFYHPVYLRRIPHRGMFPAESEQILHYRGSTLRLIMDIIEVLSEFIGRIVLKKQLRERDNTSKRIIELMSDTS